MGLYIANAVPPEECQRCPFIELMNGQWKLQCRLNLKPIPSEGKRDDCPLIDIADDVWENEKYKLIRMTQERRVNKEMAERRTDE